MDLNVKRKTALTLLCGLLGCFCFGAGDWLMLYGDTVHKGSILWLTEGGGGYPRMAEYPRHGAVLSGYTFLWCGAAFVLHHDSVRLRVDVRERI